MAAAFLARFGSSDEPAHHHQSTDENASPAGAFCDESPGWGSPPPYPVQQGSDLPPQPRSVLSPSHGNATASPPPVPHRDGSSARPADRREASTDFSSPGASISPAPPIRPDWTKIGSSASPAPPLTSAAGATDPFASPGAANRGEVAMDATPLPRRLPPVAPAGSTGKRVRFNDSALTRHSDSVAFDTPSQGWGGEDPPSDFLPADRSGAADEFEIVDDTAEVYALEAQAMRRHRAAQRAPPIQAHLDGLQPGQPADVLDDSDVQGHVPPSLPATSGSAATLSGTGRGVRGLSLADVPDLPPRVEYDDFGVPMDPSNHDAEVDDDEASPLRSAPHQPSAIGVRPAGRRQQHASNLAATADVSVETTSTSGTVQRRRMATLLQLRSPAAEAIDEALDRLAKDDEPRWRRGARTPGTPDPDRTPLRAVDVEGDDDDDVAYIVPMESLSPMETKSRTGQQRALSLTPSRGQQRSASGGSSSALQKLPARVVLGAASIVVIACLFAGLAVAGIL